MNDDPFVVLDDTFDVLDASGENELFSGAVDV